MPTAVKICGLSSKEGVDAALQVGADFLGFVFFPPSPRNVSLDQAVSLMRRVRARAKTVALFVDPLEEVLTDVVCTLDPDYLQLHGEETPERVAWIRNEYDTPVIKAVGIGSATDLGLLNAYSEAADMLLLDAKPPRDATRPGGHGATFDWSILDGFTSGKPWFLSGGLDPGNVVAALRATQAPGVDVSSCVESAPGRKDPDLIRSFIHTVRAFDQDRQPAPRRDGAAAQRLAG